MKLRRVPIISAAFGMRDIVCALAQAGQERCVEEFSRCLAPQLQQDHRLYLLSSGTAALYVLLCLLKETGRRDEVVVPAYTAASLIQAVQEAGLKPVLCEVGLDDFGIAIQDMRGLITGRTLAVIGVHMFGIPLRSLSEFRSSLPSEVFFIEDCAQAMGTTFAGRPLGFFSDASFYSFNRGKNFPLYSGGLISLHAPVLIERIEAVYRRLVKPVCWYSSLKIMLQSAAFVLASNPQLYALFYQLIRRYKEQEISEQFETRRLSAFQAALGVRIFERVIIQQRRRHENGAYLEKGLSGLQDLIIARPAAEAHCVWSRYPVLFRQKEHYDAARTRVHQAGIDCSPMYTRALHQRYSLGYPAEAFPQARFLAEHLATLPVHQGVRRRDLDVMVEVIRGVVK